MVQLSDGSVLVSGGADDLSWIPAQVPKTILPATGITSTATGQYAFILRLDKSLQNILGVVHFPQGTVRDIYKIRLTNRPGQPTGTIYISGNRDAAVDAQDGYFVARLNGNFVSATPTGCTWVYNALCVRYSTGEPDYKKWQPWDVGSDGKVVLGTGREFDANWAQILRLNESTGQPEVVKNWRAHWSAAGEWDGTPSTSYTGASPLIYSAVVMKAGRKGSLRSATSADHNLLQADGNGGTARKGRFPDDYYYSGPCDFSASSCAGGPGYTGYTVAGSTPTQRCVDIAIDRRDNSIYFGYGTKSVLPSGDPDFEPAVIAFDSSGTMKWWSRLYEENNSNSTPDQYIDGVAIDYAANRLVVLARCHGNNVTNFWNGNNIAANAAANGFQNQFTGNAGNIHISWLGKLSLASGVLQASTYVAEFAEAATGLGAAATDPALDGWPGPNAGWPTLNTTRCTALRVTANGSVCVSCVGRRTMTTANAYQKMPRPGTGSVSALNAFVRVYAPDLSKPIYSSLLVGKFDTLTGTGGDNTTLGGIFKTDSALLITGLQKSNATTNVPVGADLATTAVPAWGGATPQGQSAVLARYAAAALVHAGDNPIITTGFSPAVTLQRLALFPNAASGLLQVQMQEPLGSNAVLHVYDAVGKDVLHVPWWKRSQTEMSMHVSSLPSGVYAIVVRDGNSLSRATLVVAR